MKHKQQWKAATEMNNKRQTRACSRVRHTYTVTDTDTHTQLHATAAIKLKTP